MGGFLQLEAPTCPMRGVWWRPLRRCTKISISLSIRRPSFVSCVSPQPSFLYLDIVYSDAAIPGATLSSTLSSLGAASQAWIIPCNSQFTFGFVVGSQTFTLNTESLVIQLGDGTCVSAIESWTDASNNHYLLGARFISSVYLCVLVSFLYLGLTTNIVRHQDLHYQQRWYTNSRIRTSRYLNLDVQIQRGGHCRRNHRWCSSLANSSRCWNLLLEATSQSICPSSHPRTVRPRSYSW